MAGSRPSMLGVLLCYNDGDMLRDAIEHLLENDHHVVVWNHGSTDETGSVLEELRGELLEVTNISRDVEFYDLYALMSKHLLSTYVQRYDWVSWPDQDEILEGPDRTKPYRGFVADVLESDHSWVGFREFLFWFTDADATSVISPCKRLKHYSMMRRNSKKIRAWRASATNIRWFNHNETEGSGYPIEFNLRHYPMRSLDLMRKRVLVDRIGLQRGHVNFHYEHMKRVQSHWQVDARRLHVDDGMRELNTTMRVDWAEIYGSGPELQLPQGIMDACLLSTQRWLLADLLRRSVSMPVLQTLGIAEWRLNRWTAAIESGDSRLVKIVCANGDARVVTDHVEAEWMQSEAHLVVATTGVAGETIVLLKDERMSLTVDVRRQRIAIDGQLSKIGARGAPGRLVGLVPCKPSVERPRYAELRPEGVEFDGLHEGSYYLFCEPESGDRSPGY